MWFWLAAWAVSGWLLGILYFRDMLDDGWTWLIIAFEAPILGPTVLVTFALDWIAAREKAERK